MKESVVLVDLLYTLVGIIAAKCVFPVICVIIYALTGINISAPLLFVAALIKEKWGVEWVVVCVVAGIIFPTILFLYISRALWP